MLDNPIAYLATVTLVLLFILADGRGWIVR